VVLRRTRLVCLIQVALLSCASAATEKATGPAPVAVPADVAAGVKLVEVARGLTRPVALVPVPGDVTRMYVVEQVGRIRVLANGALVKTPVLDIKKLVSKANEQGLLGLAFHPKFVQNRRLYVNYTDVDGNTHVTEYKLPVATPDRIDPASARDVLVVPQPYANHNGGHVLFGPDGKLWIGLGDGGAANDPHKNGQNKEALLGKMLRLDVDASPPAKPVIQLLGLRNPWRYTFDRKTGDLYIADVGQDVWEELDVLPAADALTGGQNLGWNLMEGAHCFQARTCKRTGLTLPVIDYDHKTTGCSITGGIVYRGAALPALAGAYFYSDFCTGIIRSLRWKAGAVTDHWDWRKAIDPDAKVTSVSHFAEDAAGELYLVSLDGKIWKLAKR
jgi:glucose/arabinose dehydrogenase